MASFKRGERLDPKQGKDELRRQPKGGKGDYSGKRAIQDSEYQQ